MERKRKRVEVRCPCGRRYRGAACRCRLVHRNGVPADVMLERSRHERVEFYAGRAERRLPLFG